MFKKCKEKTLQRAIIILETMKTDSTLCQQNLLKIQPLFSYYWTHWVCKQIQFQIASHFNLRGSKSENLSTWGAGKAPRRHRFDR